MVCGPLGYAGGCKLARPPDQLGPGQVRWYTLWRLGGDVGRLVDLRAERAEKRCEAGVTDWVAGRPEPGGEGVASERAAVPAQLVPRGAGGGKQAGQVGGWAGDRSRATRARAAAVRPRPPP